MASFHPNRIQRLGVGTPVIHVRTPRSYTHGRHPALHLFSPAIAAAYGRHRRRLPRVAYGSMASFHKNRTRRLGAGVPFPLAQTVFAQPHVRPLFGARTGASRSSPHPPPSGPSSVGPTPRDLWTSTPFPPHLGGASRSCQPYPGPDAPPVRPLAVSRHAEDPIRPQAHWTRFACTSDRRRSMRVGATHWRRRTQSMTGTRRRRRAL